LTARADDDAKAPAKMPEAAPAPGAAAAPAPAAPCTNYRTICVTEWVPEKSIVERTVNKVEWKQETYTAYKCETVQVQKQRCCTVYEMVPETRCETRIVCKKVPVCEERTIMEKKTVCVPVEKCVKKCVQKGHWECKQVECKPSCFSGLFSHKKDDCCNPCCEQQCPKYKTVKCWVNCPVYEEKKVCVMEKHTECVAKKVKVTVCKEVREEQKVNVTVCKCVPKQKMETYTVCEKRMVPYQATRCVKVCTPCVEKVECCKMVKRTVQKQVPCEPCCDTCCPEKKCHRSKSCCN
jgi:hypothetical protein